MSATSYPIVDLKSQYQRLEQRIQARVSAVLESGQYLFGPEVRELESRLAAYTGAHHVVACANGSDALQIVMMAEGIGPGDAVFVPAMTFLATAEMVVTLGATPVFVDIDLATYNMSPDHLAERIEDVEKAGTLRPKAVIPVDLFGLPADYAAIHALAEKHGLFVLADAAQSFGGSANGRTVGAMAPASTTSFYPSKPLACYGDGGAIFTDSAELAEKYRCLANHGQNGHTAVAIGMNSRLDTIQAAILLCKLDVFDEEMTVRRAVAERYRERLHNVVTTPDVPDGSTSAWALYSVMTENRDDVIKTLNDNGVGARIYYPLPLHLQPAYAQYGAGEGSLPAAERMSRTVMSLPIHGYLEERDVDRICDAVGKVVGQ